MLRKIHSPNKSRSPLSKDQYAMNFNQNDSNKKKLYMPYKKMKEGRLSEMAIGKIHQYPRIAIVKN